jgi:DNA modification methylase
LVRQLRDYGYECQWGLEPTYNQYLEHLWEMMDEIYRVLKPTGTVWINLGDTYSNSSYGNISSKCLLLLPHRFAIGCIERGWILRNDVIWAKRNGMPESVTDRFTKKHEYIFFMVKSQKYYFDLDSVRDNHAQIDLRMDKRIKYNGKGNANNFSGDVDFLGQNPKGKNCGDVADFWDIPTKPNKEKHYASYNDALLRKPILAGCPEFVCVKCGKPRMIERKPILFDEKDRDLVEYDKSKPYAIQERSGLIEARDLPPLKDIKEYLKKWKGEWTIEKIEEILESQAPHHWFSAESYPTVEDWYKIKDLLKFDDTYDYQMTTIKYKPSEKGETEYETKLSDCGCNVGFESGIVYDPFIGTGSTAEVAIRANRRFIGSEMSSEYVKIANKRLEPFLVQQKLF